MAAVDVAPHVSADITRLNSYVGFDSITRQIEHKLLKRGFQFNVIAVGQTGLGKSTLINTIFASHLIDTKGRFEPDEPVRQTTEIQAVSHIVQENNVKLRLNIVDTPGYGDLINNEGCWDPIIKYIKDQHSAYLRKELTAMRDKYIVDTRIHCCLYFIAPTGHALKAIDITVMKKLSEVVNVVPVIAKSDSLTLEERELFKQRVSLGGSLIFEPGLVHSRPLFFCGQIRAELAHHNIRAYPFDNDDDDNEERKLNEAIRNMIPFAVVGSERNVIIDGRPVRGRKNRWGVINVENEQHCEFNYLRNFLTRTHLQDLIETTAQIHYEAFRSKQLLALKESSASKAQQTTALDQYQAPQLLPLPCSRFEKADKLGLFAWPVRLSMRSIPLSLLPPSRRGCEVWLTTCSTMLAVSYANSCALSTKHYQLVRDLENGKTDEATLNIVLKCLKGIKQRWKKGTIQPSTIRHDLLLALYCHQMIEGIDKGHLSKEEKEVLGRGRCLVAGVQLAGRGEGTTEERGVGYRVCHELFPDWKKRGAESDEYDDPHQHGPLKLLLINTIRADVYTPLSFPRAEARWILGLRAAASSTIAGPELVPAIAGRVLDLLAGGDGISSSIRRSALDAIQNLLEIATNTRLVERTRKIVRNTLMGFGNGMGMGMGMEGVSEKVKGKRREVVMGFKEVEELIVSETGSNSSTRTRTVGMNEGKGEDPKLVLAFVRATRRKAKGGLYPIFVGAEEIMRVCLGVLGRVLRPESMGEGGEGKAFEYGGLKCVWLVLGVLERVLEELREGVVQEEEMGKLARELVRAVGWAGGGRMGVRDADLEPLLSAIATSLHSATPNSRLFALRTLSLVPTSIWSTLSDVSKGWGDKAWSTIMRGLDDPDSAMRRKLTLRVLQRVEPALVGMHWARMVEGIKGVGGDGAGDEGVLMLVRRLIEVMEVVKKGGEEWAKTIVELVDLGSGLGAGDMPIETIILPTIERFTYSSDEQTRYDFAKTLLGYQGAWSDDLTLALILAAVVHALTWSSSSSEEEVGYGTTMDASKKMLTLLDQDGRFAQELQEPFLIALLRLSSSINRSERLEELCSFVQGCKGRRATFATRPLFDLLALALKKGTVERKVIGEMRESGRSGRYGSLTLPAWEGVYRRLLRKARDEEGKGEEEETWTSPARIIKPQTTPLKYDPYDALPSSSSEPTHSRSLSQYSTTSSTQAAQKIGISPRALARERQDLLRDRVERGGKGGMGESVLFDARSEVLGGGSSLVGRLALIGFQGGDDEEEEKEEVRERDSEREGEDNMGFAHGGAAGSGFGMGDEGDPFRMG
ncbi:BQ2448_1959 [Microbotryum intermedium]|uniref:BQ2448_1959 protein n=1 Tax=Microbotryum intermedium TaxID=269621 RepID=A0A238F852_9BASI|nr:BQ2448_1959 [Microbotryum intermedium]